jgi:hypothetical protein
MAFKKLPDIPFFLKQAEVAKILGLSINEVRTLVRSGELRFFESPGGPRVGTESLCLYLGRAELRARWPLVAQNSGAMKSTIRS